MPGLVKDTNAPKFRDFDDVDGLRTSIIDNTLGAFQSLPEVSYGPYRLQLERAELGVVPPHDYETHKQALMNKTSLGVPVWGTWNLYKDNELIDRKRKLLANIPLLTKHGTFIKNGVEYSVANQARLKPGVFARIKDNGDIESHFNVAPGTGKQFRIHYSPETNEFDMVVGQGKMPLGVILKAMGATEKDIEHAWGKDIARANPLVDHEATIAKAAVKLGAKPDKDNPPAQALNQAMAKTVLDEQSTTKTLGKPFKGVNVEAILSATNKLLKLHRGEVHEDSRDDLMHQMLYGPEDFFPERVKHDGVGSIRKTLWMIARKGNLSAVPSGMFNGHMDDVLMNSGLGNAVEETNLTEVADQMFRVSRLGQGAITSLDAIPDAARGVQPSFAGFLDPIRSPECFDSETYLLTRAGYKNVADLTLLDELACNINGRLEFHKPSALNQYDYDGEMYGVKTAFIDYLVTPNHRIWSRSHKGKAFEIKLAQDVYGLHRFFEASEDILTLPIINCEVKAADHYKQHYTGKVYCPTVPGGLVFIRRGDGIGHWSGNSEKIGVDLRASIGAKKGLDHKFYTKLRNVKTGQLEYVPADISSSAVVAFPGEMDGANDRVTVVSNNSVKRVSKDKVDYELPSGNSMLTMQSNLMPGVSGISGGRVFLGAKFIAQSLPLVNRESPLVRVPDEDGIPYEVKVGNKYGSVMSKDIGIVSHVDNKKIVINTPAGKKTYDLADYLPHNRKSYLKHLPQVKVGDKVSAGQLLASSNITDPQGTLALGSNLNVAYFPFVRGDASTYEDAAVLTESGAKKLTADQLYMQKLDHKLGEIDKNKHIAAFPGVFTKEQLDKIGPDGIAKPGVQLNHGDPVILAVKERNPSKAGMLAQAGKMKYSDASVLWEHDAPGTVTDATRGDKGAAVAVAAPNPMHVGDKLAGRYADKHVVSAIIPDEQAPRLEDGSVPDIIVNPLGLVSRSNPSQVVEMMLGKIAKKTGKVQHMPGFMKGNRVEWAAQELAKAGLKEKESLYDPMLNRNIPNVATGTKFYMRLHHLAENKLSGRGAGGFYTSEGAPGKGGSESAPRVGLLEVNALIAAGANKVLEDAHMYRGHKNADYWRAVKMGLTPSAPDQPEMLSKFFATLAAAGVHVEQKGTNLNLLAMTDDQVDRMAQGEVTKPELVKPNTLEPIPGGLFDRGVTGGHGGVRFGKIELGFKMPNPVLEDPVRQLLDLTEDQFRNVLAGKEKLGNLTGPEAIETALGRIDVKSAIARDLEESKSASRTARDRAIKRLRTLTMLNNNSMKPTDMLISKVLVLPPAYRPISKMNDVPLVNSANTLYKELLQAKELQQGLAKELGAENTGNERLGVYDAAKAVVGLGDPVSKESQQRGVKGLLKVIFGDSPKLGQYQRKMMGTTVDLGGRAVVTPDPRLDMDQVAIPENGLWKVYQPFIMRRLVQRGLPALQAAEATKNKTEAAKDALLAEMKVRPVIINRAPTLHKYGIMGAWPVMTSGKSLRAPVVVNEAYNLDHDGDDQHCTVVIAVDKKHEENFRKCLPSHNADYILPIELRADDGRLYRSEEMAARFGVTLHAGQGVNWYCLDLQDFPRIGDGKVKEHITFYQVPEGVYAIAYDEKSNKPILAAVSGWSEHRDREVVVVTLTSGRQIVTDDDPRAVYGIDPETFTFKRCRPSEAANLLVPRVDRMDNQMIASTVLSIPGPNGDIKLDENFGYLVGAIAGDGWVSHHNGDVKALCLAGINEGIQKKFVELTATYAPGSGHVSFVPGKHSYGESMKMTSADIDLGELIEPLVGTGARNKHLPEFYLSAPLSFRKGLAAGLLDTDGTVAVCKAKAKKNSQLQIAYSSVSLRLIREVQQLFRSIGVKSRIGSTKTPACKPYWLLSLVTNDVQKADLKLQHTEKSVNLLTPGTDPKGPAACSSDMVPMSKELAKEVSSLIVNKVKNSTYVICRKALVTGRLSRMKAKEIIAAFDGRVKSTHWNTFKMIVNDETTSWEGVDKIEVTGIKETGYDLTVPGYETFMSVDGLILSNTMSFQVPASEAAVKEVIEKMMPSRNLVKNSNFKAHFLPRHEFQMGLWQATKPSTKTKVKKFNSAEEVTDAFKRGELELDDVIDVPGLGDHANILDALVQTIK